MKIQTKSFSGVMNVDDPIEVVPNSHHIDATNVVFKGNGDSMKMQNIPGNRLVTNSLLPAGTNKTIGSYYDALNNRIFVFNYNSNSNHGIYVYNTLSGSFQRLLESNNGTDGDILNFTANAQITSINVINGDSVDGDILCFVDSLKRPTKLNVQRFLAGTYSNVKRSFINVIKAPPQTAPQCSYGTDTTYTGNNVKNALFQFIYRYVYDDNEKSVWSSGSAVCLPMMPNNEGGMTNSNFINNNIIVYFNTGDVNVKKIEVAFRKTKDGATSDYNLIQSFSKSELSIPSNNVYKFKFYNDGIYIAIDKSEQILLFDYVPDEANAQELLNGTTLIYGGIKEGYDNVAINASIAQDYNYNFPDGRNGLLFFAEQINTNTIKVVLDGAMSSSTTMEALYNSAPTPGTNLIVYATDSSNTYLTFGYVTTSNVLSNAISGLASAATAMGFTVTATDTNSITITKAGALLCGTKAYYNQPSVLNSQWDVLYTLFPNSQYQYGIVYYDENGKTNGVNTSNSLKVSTLVGSNGFDPETQFLGKRVLTINSLAPSWAKYYHIVRTNNLTIGDKSLYWVTSGALSDKDVSVSKKYVFLKIDNIYDYNNSIKATEGVVGYTFSQGDRVKFIQRFNNTGSSVTNLSTSNFDYEIISLETNPSINGVQNEGSYIKIEYPANDISSTFAFDGTQDFRNYEILIYNKPAVVSASEQTYYEIGVKGYIGPNGNHLGNLTNQNGLGVPCTTEFRDGDFFYRNRNIIVSPSIFLTGNGISSWATPSSYKYYTVTIGDSTQDLVTPNYTIGHSVEQSVTPANIVYNQYPAWVNPTFNYYNTSAVDYNVRFKFSFSAYNIDVNKGTLLSAYIKIYNATSGYPTNSRPLTQILNPVRFPQADPGMQTQVIDVNVDAIVKIPSGYKASILFYNDNSANRIVINPFTIDITPMNSINIKIADNSFSDIYNISTDSKSRPLVVDQDAKRLYSATMVRYGQEYEIGTSTNRTNRFFAADYDTYDKKYGDIMRFRLYNKELRVFQYRKCGSVPVFAVQTLNQDGTNNLVASSNIINPIRYYDGDFGIGNQPTSLASSGYVDYFVDPIKGYILRLSQDGITTLSETYKMQTFAGNNLPKYLNNYTHQYGGNAKITGVYHFSKDRHGEFICTLQSGTGLTGYTLAFDEIRNCFTSFYSFNPDWSINYENKLVTFKGGNLYIHDSSTMNNFYGTQYDSSVKVVFNDAKVLKHRFNTITTLSNVKWLAATDGDIQTALGQTSKLIDGDFLKKDDKYHASFKRATNSTGGLYNGNVLKGSWMSINLKPVSPQNLVDLYYLEISTLEPLNNR